MASKSWRENSALKALLNTPHIFSFFQAMRLLESFGGKALFDEGGCDNNALGEKIRFHVVNSLGFPSSEIEQIKIDAQTKTIEIFVSFFGVNGSSGVLPIHYTELLIQRLRYRDTALRDFFDIFNHRAISLFYAAWAKYRLYANSSRITDLLLSKIGLGTECLQNRLAIPDEALIFYSGLFHQPRSASVLQTMLCDYFEFPVKVMQFQGEWLYLRDSDRTCLGERCARVQKACKNSYNSLGVNFVLGQKIWRLQNRFRICIGAVSYAKYRDLLPKGQMFSALCSLVRYYVGVELNFDIQVILCAAEVPYCCLGYAPALTLSKSNFPSYLGWNTWLKTRPFQVDAGDLVLKERLDFK